MNIFNTTSLKYDYKNNLYLENFTNSNYTMNIGENNSNDIKKIKIELVGLEFQLKELQVQNEMPTLERLNKATMGSLVPKEQTINRLRSLHIQMKELVDKTNKPDILSRDRETIMNRIKELEIVRKEMESNYMYPKSINRDTTKRAIVIR